MKESDIGDYKKIGVEVIRIYKSNNSWLFKRDGREYNMAPSEAVRAVLSPTILGANRLIEVGCGLKGISNPENGFYLLFSTGYFPNCDVKLTFKEVKFDGWVYSVEGLGLEVPKVVESIWVCPYLSAHYRSGVPKILYLRVLGESRD